MLGNQHADSENTCRFLILIAYDYWTLLSLWASPPPAAPGGPTGAAAPNPRRSVALQNPPLIIVGATRQVAPPPLPNAPKGGPAAHYILGLPKIFLRDIVLFA